MKEFYDIIFTRNERSENFGAKKGAPNKKEVIYVLRDERSARML